MRYIIINELKLKGRDAHVKHYLEQLSALIDSKKAKLVFTGDWLGRLSDEMAYTLVTLCQKSLGVINAGAALNEATREAIGAVELINAKHKDGEIVLTLDSKGLTVAGEEHGVTLLTRSEPG